MSEIVATLPQGTQVVVEAQLLTSDVDHTIEEVRQEVQQQRDGMPCGGAVSRSSSNRTLFCRKCEGHGQQVVLKGHASRCPYNNCQCKTCSNVMSMRANAIIRRYRTRTLEGGLVLKPVHFKNGNTRLRVFPKYVDESDALTIPMGQQLQQQQQQQVLQQQSIQQPIQQQQVDQIVITGGQSQTPPATAVPILEQQPPFPVKRSFSDDLAELHRTSKSPKPSSVEESPQSIDLQNPGGLPTMSLSLLELLLRQQGLNPDLISNGLLPMTTISSTNIYDQQQNTGGSTSFLNNLSFPNTSVTYSSPTTYANTSFITNGGIGGSATATAADYGIGLGGERKLSDAALVQPAAVQLSELNIGVTTSSPVSSMADLVAPKLTPNMFEATCTIGTERQLSTDTVTAEPFTSNLMIAPTADRNHPLFRRFLNTVRELERQMLSAENS